MADPVVGPADPATVHRLLQQKMKDNAKPEVDTRPPPEKVPQQPQGVPITGRDRLNAIDTILQRMKDGDHHG